MHPISEDILRHKYVTMALDIQRNDALNDSERQTKLQELSTKMNAELLELEASGENILVVQRAFKDDIGKGVATIRKELGEELGLIEGMPILVKNQGHVVERNIKFTETPELNPIAILLDKADRDKLGVKESDIVRISGITVPDPENPN